MKIFTIPLSDVMTTNCYFYMDEESKCGFLIDPAAEAEKLFALIKQNGWTVKKILLTHGHFDHIGAVEFLYTALNVPYLIHQNGKQYLQNPTWNLSAYNGNPIILENATYVSNGDSIPLESNGKVICTLQVLHTPGHTKDSVVYYDEQNDIAFVGDTIFKDGIGATHFPGGNEKELFYSIQNVVFALPEQTILYSGHSESVSLKQRKKNFL